MMKKILITGAASAIASAIARIWAKRGAEFYLVDKNATRLQAVADDLKARGVKKVECLATDLAELASHEHIVRHVKDTLGSIDVALIAQGLMGSQEKGEKDFLHSREIFDVNLMSAVSLCMLLGVVMKEQGDGVITVISSVAGDRGRKSNYIYGAAKGALGIFSDGLRHRLAGSGVHVITVKPGFVDTPMTAGFKKGILWAKPEIVARDIDRAVVKRANKLYTPWFWRYIMIVIKMIPEPIFLKTDL